jgi:hypothetical protein
MTPDASTQPCHRCLQPVSVRARRCPHCGDIQLKNTRRITLVLAVLAMAAVLAIVALALYLSPPAVDTENDPDAPARKEAPKPARKPPLN